MESFCNLLSCRRLYTEQVERVLAAGVLVLYSSLLIVKYAVNDVTQLRRHAHTTSR
jgi:hypothetical protein